MYPSLNTPNLLPPNIYLPWKRLDSVVDHQGVRTLCWIAPNRRDGNGKETKIKASIRQYVVRQHAGAHGGIHTSENVSMKRKKSSEYAPHSSTANHMQSAPTRIANMKGKAVSEDGWSKDREEKNPGPQEDETALPAVSACQRDRISNKRASDIEKADRGAA